VEVNLEDTFPGSKQFSDGSAGNKGDEQCGELKSSSIYSLLQKLLRLGASTPSAAVCLAAESVVNYDASASPPQVWWWW
jgi:hypothetical protein